MPVRVDLSEIEVVDNHCHPYSVAELTEALESVDFLTRMTANGTMLMFESHLMDRPLDPALWATADRLTDTTLSSGTTIRWLAEFLGCASDRETVRAVRAAEVRRDPSGYARRLLESQHITAVLEAGRPQHPQIGREEFQAALGVNVYSVTRIETLIDRYLGEPFDEFVSGVEKDAVEAAADPNVVAYKSLIAYRSGLDVRETSRKEAAEAYATWGQANWVADRRHAKPVYDFMLERLLLIARREDRPLHIHCGAASPSHEHSRPLSLEPLLRRHGHQPIVLIHGGNPWVAEAAYLAVHFGNVYVDVSSLVPRSWAFAEWATETYLGMLPWSRILHGSDEAGDPEDIWLAARHMRSLLSRILAKFVTNDYITAREAEDAGRGILGGNCRRLHGLE